MEFTERKNIGSKARYLLPLFLVCAGLSCAQSVRAAELTDSARPQTVSVQVSEPDIEQPKPGKDTQPDMGQPEPGADTQPGMEQPGISQLPDVSFTGIYDGKYYREGEIATSDAAYWIIYRNYLYKVSKDGAAAIYIKAADKAGTYCKQIGNIYYQISFQTGKAVKFTGVYRGIYYKSGLPGVKEKIYYVFYNNYLYRVSETGAAYKYQKDKKKSGVYMKVIGSQCCEVSYKTGRADAYSGVYNKKYYKAGKLGTADKAYYIVSKKYLYKVTKNGRAALYKRNKKKSGVYPFVVGKKCYNVSWKTAKVSAFTGVCNGYYYKNGKVKSASKIWYAVYGKYLYQIEKNGAAKKYKKDITRIGTYQITLTKKCYNVCYKTGKAEEATMTVSEIRRMVAKKAASYLGYSETTGKHKKIINIYNRNKPRARNYKVKYTDAWCAAFVSAIAIQLNYTDLIPTECSCKEQILLWQALGRWQEKDSYVPHPGDLIYYDWTDDGRGDCRGESHHVGIVEKVSGRWITVIEGNYRNAVRRRTIKVNGRYIRGYGLPNYANKAIKKSKKR